MKLLRIRDSDEEKLRIRNGFLRIRVPAEEHTGFKRGDFEKLGFT